MGWQIGSHSPYYADHVISHGFGDGVPPETIKCDNCGHVGHIKMIFNPVRKDVCPICGKEIKK